MEREIIVDHIKLTYEGLFDAKELLGILEKFFKDKGYERKELRNIELVKPEGKYVELEIIPWKKIKDYMKNEISVRTILSEVKEVEVDKDGVKIKLNQGKVQILIDGYLTTDFENKWENKPTFFLVRTLVEKYLFGPYTDKHKVALTEDAHLLHSTLKSFLNLYRY
ncbi:MAG: hypothetical protein Q8O89_05295 [Nanoarchaeota archaeon]|nr:hypothetical protein [Nanoarchaeota archaeon]